MLEKVFENKTIRTVIKDDGIWFVAKDVADHVDDDDKVYLGTEKLTNETLPSFNDKVYLGTGKLKGETPPSFNDKVWDNNKTTLNTVGGVLPPTTSSLSVDIKNDKLIEMIVQTVFKNRR